MPLQPELLAVGAAITHAEDAASWTAALAAIAWENAEVVDHVVQLLASPHGKRDDVVSGAADALARCGPTAAAAVPELLTHIDTPTDRAARRSALLALSAITRDQDVADRCLRVLVRDQADLDTEEPSWTLAASRFAARSRDADLARSVLQALEAKAHTESQRVEGAATFDAAIALVASGLGDQERRDTALAALKARFTLGSVSPGFDPNGNYRHSVFAAAIELLIDLLLTHPDTVFDLTPVMAQLDHFDRAQATWIRDWAHHQRSRLPR